MTILGTDPAGASRLDNSATDGLSGTEDSLAYRVNEIERHFHNREHWFGNGAAEGSLTPYTLTSGNADYGTEVLLLDTGDTPVIAGMEKFDVHELFVDAFSANTVYYIQIVWGSGTFADSLAAGNETVVPVRAPSVGSVRGAPVRLKFRRQDAGTKVWGRCKNATNSATMGVFIGLHEYEG